MDTDAKTGLATISIGSDSGIKAGNRLEVYRLKPDPKYLGKIEVLDVRQSWAAVRVTDAARFGSLEVGDHVVSRITRSGVTKRQGEPEESKAKIHELEMKIDRLTKQIDSLREELKLAKPRSGSGRRETIPGTGSNSGQPTVEGPANRQ